MISHQSQGAKANPDRCAAVFPVQLLHHIQLKTALPIGSGEIESAHRYVIQQRLKRSGSWWSVENAWAILALRVLRQNQDWCSYWSGKVV